MNSRVIAEAIHKILPATEDLRRKIHQEPELANEEVNTSGKILQFLGGSPLVLRPNIGGTGIVADLKSPAGAGNTRTIAFRADMDALPIEERTGLSYQSARKGIMHACGHDFHSAILAGSAAVLCDLQSLLKCNLRFIFQPAEEDNPRGGAVRMIEEAALDNVDAVFGLHVWPDLKTGEIGFCPGPAMAASDRIVLRVYGKSAHAAKPEMGVDSIVISGHILSVIQSVISRKISPLDSSVITFGKIEGGDRYNIIAQETRLYGTLRNTSQQTREMVSGLIEKIASGVAESFGGNAEMEYLKGYPVLVNDPGLSKKAASILRKDLGEGSIRDDLSPTMVSEDFGYYSQKAPCLFMWLGCSHGNIAPQDRIPLHSPFFRGDEGCIETGISAFVSLALGM